MVHLPVFPLSVFYTFLRLVIHFEKLTRKSLNLDSLKVKLLALMAKLEESCFLQKLY